MGDEIATATFTREQRTRYREKVRRCLDVFAQMLAQDRLDGVPRPVTGLEMELNLVAGDFRPAMRNDEVLATIADPAFQTELGRYNIELNMPPARPSGAALRELEDALRGSLNRAQGLASDAGAEIVMIGILPTLRTDHLLGDWMTANPRYRALDDAILATRREDIELDISGPESLHLSSASIGPESACTSVQLHLQLPPGRFAAHWNAAQLLAGPQLALGANSPFLFGRALWAETRTELFLQATDTRAPELRNQGVRPPVWFGDRWITSIFDLFEENVRYFPALLPEITDEDPEAVLAAGGVPRLQELRLHNGTVYRWNRPVYDVADGVPHVRLENRVLPAGPTVVDVVANAAFFYGAVTGLVAQDRPAWSRMSFSAARDNFEAAARHGVDASLYWPGVGEVPWDELVLRHLLPVARAGLEQLEVDDEVIDRYLGVVEARCKLRRNGASWQTEAVARLQAGGADREEALAQMLRHYAVGMHRNDPVHTWPLP